MSKYTTEVRFICEQKAGLTKSVGFNGINDVLDKSWDKIFTKNWEMFDESYRKILCEKILRSYYTREICAETVGLWQLWMDATLCEIMPAYNQLYKTTIYEFNPLYNTDMTTTFTKSTKGTDSKTGNSTGSNNVNVKNNRVKEDNYIKADNLETIDSGKSEINNTRNGTTTNNHNDNQNETNKYNDTPQGGLSDIESNTYLTDIRMINKDNTSTDSSTETAKDVSTGISSNTNTKKGKTENSGTTTDNEYSVSDTSTQESSTEQGISETLEEWTERVIGKNNSENYGQLLIDFRKSIINIDKMIIDELKPLFMQLW